MESLEKKLSKKEQVALEIQNKSETLQEQHSVPVELFLTEDEVDIIDKFNMPEDDGDLYIDYYGGSEDELRDELSVSLEKITENDLEINNTVVDVISRTVMAYLQGMNYESVWLTVRIALPDDSFQVPRWHVDGRYYRTEEPAYKFVATLKGSKTRFAKIIDKEKFASLSTESWENDEKEQTQEELLSNDTAIRKRIEETVEEVNISNDGEGVIFLVGDENAVPHSEPESAELRIFFSVVGGTKEQIEEISKRRSR